MKRVVIPIAILASCILFALYLINTPVEFEEAAPEVYAVTVRVARVKLDSVQLVVESQGKVQAAQQASLAAAVAGPIAWISPSLQAGAYVEAGQTLLRLDASDFETSSARRPAFLQPAQAEAALSARSTQSAALPAVMPYEPSPEEAKQLEALGYIDDAR